MAAAVDAAGEEDAMGSARGMNVWFFILVFAAAATIHAERVTEGVVAVYDFEENGGTAINDLSGIDDLVNFTIPDPAAVQWIPGGLAVIAPTRIISDEIATKVYDSCTIGNQITIEAWVRPTTLTADGPARIVSLSIDSGNRNFTLAQDGATYVVRLRTTTTGNNGVNPVTQTAAGALTTELTHVVYTWDSVTSEAVLYLNGQPAATQVVTGDLSTWDPSYQFVLANEIISDPIDERDWPGEYYLVAIYERALSAVEVTDNFEAGPGLDTACPFGVRASLGPGGVNLAWKNGENTPNSVRILRNGAVIAAAAAVDPPAYTDTSALPGLLDYELVFDVPGEDCPSLKTQYNGCITDLQAASAPSGIGLSWQNNLTYPGIEIRRNGEVIQASLPGGVEAYTDQDAAPGQLTYALLPTNGTCDPATVTYDGCISGLAAQRIGDAVLLTWQNAMPYTGIEIRRNGEVLEAALPGSSTTYTDNAAPQEGVLSYSVSPTTGTCLPATVEIDLQCWLPAPVCAVPPGGPGGELVAAFAFGVHSPFPAGQWCFSHNEPAVPFTPVEQTDPFSLAYDAQRGWGYEVLYDDWVTDSLTPYGDRGGYEIFGPFDDTANNRSRFGGNTCPEDLYDSFIGSKDFTTECSEATVGDTTTPCAAADLDGDGFEDPPEGIIFRVDVAPGTYRFVAAVGDSDNPHAHRILAEDGGEGAPEEIGPNSVVLVHNFDQAQFAKGEVTADRRGEGVFARVGFNGLIPPPGDGVSPSPQFINMDEEGNATPECSTSPTLTVASGSIRIHQLQGNSNDGCGGSRDPNGGDLVILELWKVDGEPPENAFRRGDANRDGGTNIADAVYILQNLFANGPPLGCKDAADANDDEGVNIADAVYILQNLFANGPAIPPPSPDCGVDTTLPAGQNDLGCEDYCAEACQNPPTPCQ